MTSEKFDQVDRDGSGTIEWSEFKDAMICICGSWRASFIWDMTHSYATWLVYKRYDSYNWMEWMQRRDDMHLRYVTCLIHMRHDSFIWDMTHSYEIWLIHMRHDSFIWDMTHLYETWLIHMRHDSFICDMTHLYETWLIHTRYDSLFRMRQNSFICDMTHSYETWRNQTDSLLDVIEIVQANGVSSKTWRYVFALRHVLHSHGGAATSRLLTIIALFCKRDL